MTLQQVAQHAGVSASTVCRVINSMPGITPETASNVQRSMKALAYTPTVRRRGPQRPAPIRLTGTKVGFVVLDLAGPRSVPKYDELIRGVSSAATQFGLDMHMSFMTDVDAAVEKLGNSGFNGLILHGTCPPIEKSQRLHAIPTVWMMGNPRRPTWGDQVMPDNATIGQLAAQYLLQRGHRNVLYFGLRAGWSLATRSLAFLQAMEDAGGKATVLTPPVTDYDVPHIEDVDRALAELAVLCRSADPMPTGLFIGEDYLVRPVFNTLNSIGVRIGEGGLDVISCNNDRAHLIGASPMPATIDIQAEAIGAHAVEQLVQRLRTGGLKDRVRIMLEPELVLPTDSAPM
ncbi:MAG: LacI family DNA-binding transcriptional regulator [Tepidisphaeraceae bacterium]